VSKPRPLIHYPAYISMNPTSMLWKFKGAKRVVAKLVCDSDLKPIAVGSSESKSGSSRRRLG
jgi:hypothetical protein